MNTGIILAICFLPAVIYGIYLYNKFRQFALLKQEEGELADWGGKLDQISYLAYAESDSGRREP